MKFLKTDIFQEQPLADVLQNRFSQKFGRILMKISLLESLFNQDVGLQLVTLFEKETPAQVSSFELRQIFKNFFFTEHLQGTASHL